MKPAEKKAARNFAAKMKADERKLARKRATEKSAAEKNQRAATRNRPSHRKSAVIVGVFLGVVLMAVGGFVVTAMWNRDPIPLVTETDFEAALARWEKNGPTSYDVDVVLSGQQTGNIHVEVRRGQVTLMTRNHVKPDQRRTWDYWTIPSQFATIRQDFDAVRDPALLNQPPGTQVVIYANFDPKYGLARRYRRQVLGAHADIQWTVTRFVPEPETE
jgi:hypothetical protein